MTPSVALPLVVFSCIVAEAALVWGTNHRLYRWSGTATDVACLIARTFHGPPVAQNPCGDTDSDAVVRHGVQDQ